MHLANFNWLVPENFLVAAGLPTGSNIMAAGEAKLDDAAESKGSAAGGSQMDTKEASIVICAKTLSLSLRPARP